MTSVQDIFKQFYPKYKKRYRYSFVQNKTANAIMECRTSALGGHANECEQCGHLSISYNSCRNRHCPLCQTIPKEKWIDARKKDILSAPYFHVVFTVPDEVKMVIYQNQKLLYALLYQTVAETLTQLAGFADFLGAQIGFISVLHTWGQALVYHPHIHTIVLAGGLTKEGKWRCSSKKFFIPVKVLSEKIMKKFLCNLKTYYSDNKLKFYGKLKEYENPEIFSDLINILYRKSWYTYCKETFSGPLAVIEYLGRYTHRVAISNNRIQSMNEKTVSFKWKDYKDKGKEKLLTMDGVEFVRRFLMHVLPRGFVKLRHYGILGNRNKKTKLELCRKLTKSIEIKPLYADLNTMEILMKITGKDLTKCPACLAGDVMRKMLLPKRASPS